MKTLKSKNKNFEKTLDRFLSRRRDKVRSNSVIIKDIIKDIKKKWR